MLCAPVMHTDCTNARVNGKNAYVFVCALPEGPALYFAREKKGHAGVKGTVTEDYQGILVHDHESTFYSYGTDHQECLAHILRALKGSEENEKDRIWNSKMRELIRDMIHYRKHLPEDEEVNDNQVREYEEKYFQILDLAREEYENIPPGDYYREGYNLYLRLHEYSHNHLLFLPHFCDHSILKETYISRKNSDRKNLVVYSFSSDKKAPARRFLTGITEALLFQRFSFDFAVYLFYTLSVFFIFSSLSALRIPRCFL